MLSEYDQFAVLELKLWQAKMLRPPSFANRIAGKMQRKINSYIPEKVHQVITGTIKRMIEVVLFGSELTKKPILPYSTLAMREAAIKEQIEFYKKAAAAEGGITGAGGFLLGLADFPLLISLKIKMLFDIAAISGFDSADYRERIYLLYIFQLAFSNPEKRREIFIKMTHWEDKVHLLSNDINHFDWRTFQQEYRDYIDLVKIAQLIPIIGAPVGAIVNYRLLDKLGKTAIQAYRMRILKNQ